MLTLDKIYHAAFVLKDVARKTDLNVAGDHANNDMAGEDEDSWLSQFEASEKFESVDTQILGLGEIEGIQKLYVDHTAKVIDAE